MSDLNKQNKADPDWLPKSNALLPSDSSQKNPNSNLTDYLQFSPLSGDGDKSKIPYGLAGESKDKPGSKDGDPHSGDPETINPNSARNVSGSVEQSKASMQNNRANSDESINGNPPNWARNTIGDEGIKHPKGDVPGPGSKEPSGEAPPEYLRNPLKDMKTPPVGADVPVLGGKATDANRGDYAPKANPDDYTRTAVESAPAEGDKKSASANGDKSASADGDKKTDKVNDAAEARRAENARQAADILTNRGDLGNDYQRSQIREMYRQALEQGGPAAVADLTRAINKELERRGSDVRVSANIDLPRFPSFGSTDGMGYRLDVTKGSQKVDEMRVAPSTRWDAYPDGRERLSR